jgi:hypothetical protein
MRRVLGLLCALSIPIAYGRADEGTTVVEKGGTREIPAAANTPP